MEKTADGLNRPLKRKSLATTLASSCGLGPVPCHLKGTTAIGRALLTPSVITMSMAACAGCVITRPASRQYFTIDFINRTLVELLG